ncbi:MAG TPA: TetR/AcrR family transcriptional regulator [Symbiobacteriaceae bacterium]|jgi:AcrR family transcriptional regulator
MAARAEDRRVQRTRTLLLDALMELMLEKGYETVTIQDIIDRANVGRSTFYAHFLDKEALLLSGFEQLRLFLTEHVGAAPVAANGPNRLTLGFSLAMLHHVQSHHMTYRAIVGKQSGAIVHQQFQRIVADLVKRELSALAPSGALAVPLDVVVQYTVSAFLALMTWWLDQKMPCSAEEMDRMFRTLTLPGIAAALPQGDWPSRERRET